MTKSNGNNQDNLPNRALSTLALGIAEKSADNLLPVSDEELFDLSRNQLNDERRARVMHSIANDIDTYHRWIEMVQTLELDDELGSENTEALSEAFPEASVVQPAVEVGKGPERSPRSEKWNLLGGLASWLKADRNWMGTGAGIALAALLVVIVAPQMLNKTTLDELYDQYAMSGSFLLPEKSISSVPDTEKKRYSTAETEVAKGIVNGFEVLNALDLPLKWVLDPKRYSLSENKPGRGDNSLYAFGRLVALSLIQCKLADNNEYFKLAAPLVRKLAAQHESVAPQVTATGSDRSEVCENADATIRLLS